MHSCEVPKRYQCVKVPFLFSWDQRLAPDVIKSFDSIKTHRHHTVNTARPPKVFICSRDERMGVNLCDQRFEFVEQSQKIRNLLG
ncbi:unnamed protein product [Boreogadus saida]